MSVNPGYSPQAENRPSLQAEEKVEGSGQPLPYSGFWRRFVASLIDGITLSVLQIMVKMLVSLVVLTPFLSATDAWIGQAINLLFTLIAYLVSIIVEWLYYALMESSPKQATLGKMAMGIIVTDSNYRRISFSRATGRYFSKILSALILVIGYLMAAFTEKKQALHDLIAGTYVLYKGYDEVPEE